VKIAIADRAVFEAVRTGLALAKALAALYPDWHVGDLEKLVQEPRLVDAVKAGAALDSLVTIAEADLPAWRSKRDKYLIYPTIPCAL
jgi:hypothetical protein